MNQNTATIEGDIRRHAIQTHAAYPQYAGYFDGWRAAQVVSHKGMRPRGRRSLPIGTFVIAVERPDATEGPEVAVYSPGVGHVCALPPTAVRFLGDA